MMPTLLAGLTVKAKPPQKEATLNLIIALVAKAPEAIGFELVNLVGPVADLTCDIKKEVKVAAIECMQAISGCTGNKDLEPFLPAVIEAASSIANTHQCVEKLAGCVFVQNVETKALAVMLPVLQRGLSDKSEEVKRTCCQIVDNMCKVVENPASLIPVMPILEPLVKGATEKISDPEARSVAEKALGTLQKAAAGAELQRVDAAAAVKVLKEVLGEKAGSDNAFDVMLTHTGALAAMATNLMNFEEEKWKKAMATNMMNF